jgi:mono/diheme cytochrome c family protein
LNEEETAALSIRSLSSLAFTLLLLSPLSADAQGLDGKLVFTLTCSTCHRKGGAGTQALAKEFGSEESILEDRTDLTADLIRETVTKGRKTMPPVRLTQDQLQAVIAYLTK